MLLVISPAKALDFDRPALFTARQNPRFVDRAAVLIERLRALSPQEVAALITRQRCSGYPGGCSGSELTGWRRR